MSSLQRVYDDCTRTRTSPLRIHHPQHPPITSPGTLAPRPSVTQPPTFSLSSSLVTPGKKYLVVAADPDAPSPLFSTLLSPMLHLIHAGLEPHGEADEDGWVELKATEEEEAAAVGWLAPNPPVFSTKHRYVFMVYEHPEGLGSGDVRGVLGLEEEGEVGRWARVRWDLDGCERKLGLGEVLGGNYYCVE
ncbi:PEBP-like protein [Aaosphaeria arxii CBS 175.79]|uniref:PEBP-like protein n=1 Tax=Aaosphaeria arxii CBS 175.79 TaxID=1450172 RepID=A0A6A5YBR4_9PLEO|nr:PEBP-like protein [Aaosphaeria arxii CBS 175.79]KAF2022151.1 PEBP-like protein [Aaosphaeria arxii CBS 175.79]